MLRGLAPAEGVAENAAGGWSEGETSPFVYFCVIPPVSIPADNLATIKEYTKKIAESLHVCGLMNMQYAIENGKVYVIEANPRASRTVPLVSKVCDTQMARLATRMMLGESLESLGLKDKKIPYYGAKEAVLPWARFPGVDPILGPEMRSTGEVLGLAENFPLAFYKSQVGSGTAKQGKNSPVDCF